MALAGALASAAPAQERLRVLLVTEEVRERSALRLKKALADSGRFEVRLSEESAVLQAPLPAAYDCVVLDMVRPQPDRELSRFVASGKGLVVLRGAGEPRAAAQVRVQWADKTHPISEGMPGEFRLVDRLRSGKPPAGSTVLAVVSEDRQPVAWTFTQGKGRVFETVLGENTALVEEPAFLRAVLRGTEWAATGRVTLSFPQPRPGEACVRALVVTGGHDHEITFYHLFEGNPRIAANIDPHPMPYRRGDLRRRYDVLVLYDSMQEITEQERQTLRDFAEAGKGIVVLHHALVDYCNWQWWYEEVVGGRWYQTEDKPPRWKTSWKDNVELLVYPTAEHPVVAGVGPMHLWDETYKGMWLSPDNQVLMRTDDPSSDGPVVWISPYRRSRVVVIELGHDHTSHLHPGYRRLVENAVLWSAGMKP